MFLKKAIVVKVIILALVCVGCTSNDINKTSYTKDPNKSDIELKDENSELEDDEKSNLDESMIKSDDEKKGTVEVINEDTNEITTEAEVEVIDLIPDKDFLFPDLEQLPSDIKEWVLANKDKKKEISAYVKTTANATYVLASVTNDTGGKIAMIHTPYMISDSDEWVVTYSFMLRDKWIDSNGNEYLIMQTSKPVKIRLEHATIYEH